MGVYMYTCVCLRCIHTDSSKTSCIFSLIFQGPHSRETSPILFLANSIRTPPRSEENSTHPCKAFIACVARRTSFRRGPWAPARRRTGPSLRRTGWSKAEWRPSTRSSPRAMLARGWPPGGAAEWWRAWLRRSRLARHGTAGGEPSAEAANPSTTGHRPSAPLRATEHEERGAWEPQCAA